jgi:CRISPR-associated protein Cas2
MMDLVIAYDINTETPKGVNRLARVAAICERYGQRVQHSVFECRLSDVQHARLVAELKDAIDEEVDSVCIYHLADGIDRASNWLGRRPTHKSGVSWIL